MAALAVGLLLLALLGHSARAYIAADSASLAAAEANLTSPPGGLAPAQTPQFVLLTVDDLVNRGSAELIRAVTDGRATRDGCGVPATMFVKLKGSDCAAIRELYAAGYEIADHTVEHKRLAGRDRDYVAGEVAGARQQLVECGVPQGDVVGLRAPYLWADPQLRSVLHEQGFEYDSSLIERMDGSVSEGFDRRLWPFDMGGGIPMNCTSDANYTQACSSDERWPGLWEVPVWELDQLDGPYSPGMDPGYDYGTMTQVSEHAAFDILRANFDAAYAGNRAPLGVYVHPFWLRAESERHGPNLEQLQRFVDYALEQEGVYFVTVRQLLAWMQDPVPAEDLTPEGLGCGNPGGAGPGGAA